MSVVQTFPDEADDDAARRESADAQLAGIDAPKPAGRTNSCEPGIVAIGARAKDAPQRHSG